jgi:hypothetical protein
VHPHGAEERLQHEAVRLVDLTGGKRFARAAELGARGHDRDTGPNGAAWMGYPGRGEARESRRRERRPGAENGRARVHVPSQRPHVRARLDVTGHDDRAVLLRHDLDRHDRVGALGDDSTGRDRHRLAALEWPRRRTAGGDAIDDRERARRVGGAEGEAVHRGAREARQVDGRERVLGQHAPGRGFESHGLRRQRACPRQHKREGILDGQGSRHGADGTHGVRSAA